MCAICYDLATESHWSDAVSRTPAAGDAPLRSRHQRLIAVKAALAPFGLTVSATGVGRHLVISNGKGSSEVASSLPATWQAAERLMSHSIDVLDPDLIAAVSTARARRT